MGCRCVWLSWLPYDYRFLDKVQCELDLRTYVESQGVQRQLSERDMVLRAFLEMLPWVEEEVQSMTHRDSFKCIRVSNNISNIM